MKGKGNSSGALPGGIFRMMFDKSDGVEQFIKNQERLTEIVKYLAGDQLASRGRDLIHMVRQSKNGKVGHTWRSMLAHMSIGCRYEVSTQLFKMSAEEIATLSDTDLGKRAKEIFRDIDPQHADGIANRFIRDCLRWHATTASSR